MTFSTAFPLTGARICPQELLQDNHLTVFVEEMDHCGILIAKALALAWRKPYCVTLGFQITAFQLTQGCELLKS